MSDFDKALRDPSSAYHFPREVLADSALSYDQKHQILQQWLVDAHSLAIAEEENMAGDGPSMLSRVQRCLALLEQEHETGSDS